MKNLQNSVLTVAMAIGLAITGLSPAHASTSPTSVQRETDTITIDPTIRANAAVSLKYDQPSVSTTPATVVDAPVEIVQPVAQSESVSTVATTTVAKTATPVVSPAPVVPSFSGGAVVAAALAQLGVPQDCTALVTRSIAAVGINFHGWPAGYLSLGRTVPASEALPGDLAYYANGGMGVAHIAVYVGDGMAVHGGWNGGTTALASVNVGSGPVFIRLG